MIHRQILLQLLAYLTRPYLCYSPNMVPATFKNLPFTVPPYSVLTPCPSLCKISLIRVPSLFKLTCIGLKTQISNPQPRSLPYCLPTLTGASHRSHPVRLILILNTSHRPSPDSTTSNRGFNMFKGLLNNVKLNELMNQGRNLLSPKRWHQNKHN